MSAAQANYDDYFKRKGGNMGIISEVMKYGYPRQADIRYYQDYVLSYDTKNKTAYWSLEHLTRESVTPNDNVDRKKSTFSTDKSIHPFFQSENSDYKGSTYDRGHLASAGNHQISQIYCDETFFLTNVSPQVGVGFNRDSWRRLEYYIRDLTKTYPHIYCCTGPLYLPKKENDGKMYVKYQVVGANNVAVPTHFYKIFVGETSNGKLNLEAYIMPNEVISNDTPLKNFQVSPETVEKSSGLLFFDKIDRKQLYQVNGKKI